VVARKPLLILLRYFQSVLFAVNYCPVKPIHLFCEFAKMFRSQPPAIDGLENGHNEIFDGQDKILKFLIEGKLPQIVIQISNQMNPAFLLPARQSVISWIKVGHNYTLISTQKFLHNGSFPGFR